uniref:PP2C family protein-serine/threonine phosphatase n=1 Tax=Eubacterium cellulosolvens TaxID=29322 RepID=UPI0006868AB6|nr:PP2C family protein-serine/threonine phosphatase [[Eubacterium] cellulosolvens]
MKKALRKRLLFIHRITEWFIFIEVILLGIAMWHRSIYNIPPLYLVSVSIEMMSLVCVSILCFCCRADENFRYRDKSSLYFLGMLMICGVGLFADAMCWIMDSVPQFRYFVVASNTLYYVAGSFMIYCFWRYLATYLQIETKLIRFATGFMRVGLVITNFFIFLNLFFGYYFTVDENGTYSRGPGFIYSQLYLVIAVFSCLTIVIMERQKMTRLEIITVISYLMGPYIVQVATMNSYGLSLTFPVVFIFILIIYSVLNVQKSKNQAMTTRELKLASDIQENALPNTFPAFPQISEIDLYACMKPAKEVGGDFYDFFQIDDHRIALVMADVSGKGIPAALFMMIAKTLIKNFAQSGTMNPAEVLAATNHSLCENNSSDYFVTLWLGFLDYRTGYLLTANAGHEYPMIKTGKKGFELYKDKHGVPLASMEGLTEKNYKMTEFYLKPGDKIFVYTDGIAESINSRYEQFGTGRLRESLNRRLHSNAKETVDAVWLDLQLFIGDVAQFDDVTMLQLEYKGKADAAGTESHKEET